MGTSECNVRVDELVSVCLLKPVGPKKTHVSVLPRVLFTSSGGSASSVSASVDWLMGQSCGSDWM